MKYIILIGAKTFFRHGGNTRDKFLATRFDQNEYHIAKDIAAKYKNAKVIEVG